MNPSFCDQACKPGYNMADSCKKHCPGYNFTTTSPPTTTGTTLGASLQPEVNSSALEIIIPSVSVLCVAFVILVLLWCCRKKILKLVHSIKLRFEKLPMQETGNGDTSVSTVSVVPVIPQRTLAEVRVITEVPIVLTLRSPVSFGYIPNAEVHHPSEEEALLGDCPTDGLEDSKPDTRTLTSIV